MKERRGWLYLVIGTLRPGEFRVWKAFTGAEADTFAQEMVAGGLWGIQVVAPVGAPGLDDVRKLGRERTEARRRAGEATMQLRAAVLAALAGGHTETEVAAAAGVDRMTVRSWAGKR
jgi:hypothetical protein